MGTQADRVTSGRATAQVTQCYLGSKRWKLEGRGEGSNRETAQATLCYLARAAGATGAAG
jgi:hypothetical protein